MKKLLTIFFFLLTINAIAGHRYVSSSVGNDSNTGLDSAHPYKSLTKVNAIYSSLAAGDTILFKRGDTFLGKLAPMRSGLAGFTMVITAYGAGAKPIISGLIPLHTWTLVSGNIWQCTPDSTLKANTNVFTIAGIPQAVGRTDWFHYDSAKATQLWDNDLASMGSYVGAEVVIRKKVYVSEKATVTAQSGRLLTYSNANQQPIHNNRTAAGQAGQNGYGYFFQRALSTLDQQGEWYFDKTANKVKIYSTTNPNSASIKISFVDTVILLGSRGYTTISNISVEGSSVYGIESYGGTAITVTNCDFNNNTLPVYMWNTTDAKVEYNNIENSLNSAVVISNNQSKRIDVNYNYIHNTSQLFGMAIYNVTDNVTAGILARTDSTRAQNYVNIIGNKVVNTGDCAIYFQGSNSTVRRNICDTFANILDDMGGIYTFINNTSTNNVFYTNRIIDSNFVSNAIGAPLGKTVSGGIDVVGLYFDDQTCNTVVRYNTVYNIPGNGIQLNNPLNATVQYNTVYNCDFTINENRKPFGVISGVLISNNVLYQKGTSQLNFYTVTNSLTQPSSLTSTQANQQLGTIDSNWINDIKTTSYQSIIAGTVSNFNLSTWKSTYLHETHSTLPPITVTGSNTRLVTNASDSVLQSGFIGLRKISPKSVSYDNYISLPKWTSSVLIDNGTANIPPVSNAGADKQIILPTATVTAVGSGSDADGTIGAYVWTKISGPSTYNVVSPTSATTVINSLIEGVYQFSLTVTDNGGVSGADTMQITVIANTAPTASAGSDKEITLPTNSTSLTGTGSDADGTISSYGWSQISGPNSGTFGTASATTTTFTGLVAGVYQVKFSVTDNGGLVTRDTVQVTVNAAVNLLPTATAPADFSITLPTNSTSVTGSGSDADGTISSYSWSFISGPNTPTFGTASAATTTVNGLTQGVYRLRLTVIDNSGGQGTDDIDITVNAAANMTPTSLPGSNQTITLPINTVTLSGSGTDPDGSITAYVWSQISGPSCTIVSPSAPNTAVNGLTEGVYVFELMVTDNYPVTPGTATAQVTITVLPNPAPVANAGSDIQKQLPTNTATLTGSGTDDISISSYAWVKISGPSGGAITSPTSATTGLTGLQFGVYGYELTVTDNGGATGKDTVLVTVILADNLLPSANAGSDVSFNPPRDTLTLFGIGTDTDGTIASYRWRKILGPALTIDDTTSATIIISGLTSGTYQMELTVTDDRGGIAKDTMQLIVNTQPFNIPPTGTAGPNRTIYAPRDSVTLFGSGSDVDGTVTFYWSGSGGTITDRTTATPLITGLTPGTYTFSLEVRDNQNAVATYSMTLTVVAEPVRRAVRILGLKVIPQ